MRPILLATLLAAAACGDFEDPAIVLDLRVLGAQAEPPEVVSPFDPDNPTDPGALELVPVQVCALVADPAEDRRLSYNMVACAPKGDGRCSRPNAPFVDVGFGTVDDPETADAEIAMCGTVPDSGGLLAVLQDAIERDSLSGFGGVEVQVEIAVHGEDQPFETAIFASKTVLYAPQIPDQRVANRNPTVDGFTATLIDPDEVRADPVDLPLGRCGEVTPLAVPRTWELEIEPVESAGAREEYVVPTFDGGYREFTENLRYAWFATHGDWSPNNSGGPRDVGGNQPPLDSTWKAKIPADDVGDSLLVPLWMVQRDERGGQSWYHSCIEVTP